MVGITREELLRNYGSAMRAQEAAVFIGAGLSKGAGFVDWKALLSEFARDLKLDLEIETDLTLVAQYHLNRERNVRSRLHGKLVEAFGGKVAPSPAHNLLAQLPVHLFWTSNYDHLVEDSLDAAHRKYRVFKSSSSLTYTAKAADDRVFKLHGDLDDPSTIVITRDDYARYVKQYRHFRDRLRLDLAEKTFLFLGFSFTDPHLDFILNELRNTFGENQRNHYVIMGREQKGRRSDKNFRYAVNKQKLRIEDLENFGIKTHLVDDFGEVPRLLEDLLTGYRRRQVFVSGAADDFGPRGSEWMEAFATQLGERLIAEDFNLVSGFGKGIGPHVLSGALRELYRDGTTNIDRRLLLRPFPYARPNRERYTRYRQSMLATAGFAVFIAGNKVDPETGVIINSPGVEEEFQIATGNGAIPIPVGASGHMAEALWTRVNANLPAYGLERASRRALKQLNRPGSTPTQAVDAVLELLLKLRDSRSK